MRTQHYPIRPEARRGATAVEFALTAPILFLLVLSAIEFSRANMLVHTASIAATEAARHSILPGATAAECKSACLKELAMLGISDAEVTVSPSTIDDDTKQVTINLEVPVSMKNGYVLPRFFLGKKVFKSVTLQREGKHEDASEETVVRDGMQADDSNSGKGNNGKGNSGKGNNGNGNSGNNSGKGSDS
jgi:hypothetical protein